MARRFPILALLALPLAAAEPSPDPLSPAPLSATLGVESAVSAAFAGNAELRLAEEEAGLARLRRRVAFSGLLPAVTFKAEESRGRADQAALQPSFVERLYGVQATQTLFQGGRRWGTHRQSALRGEAQALAVEKRRQLLRYEVEETYWRLAALEQARRAYAETCAELQGDLENAARHELSDNRSARIELLATRAQSRDCAAAAAETDEAIAQARERLLELSGRRIPADFSLPPGAPVRRVEADPETCVRLARGHRPELAVAEREAAAADWAERIGGSARLPRVDLNGFWGRSGAAFDETEPFDYRRDWNAGVRVSWGIFGNTAGYSAARERTSPKLGESSRTELETQSVSLALGDSLQTAVDAAEGRKTGWAERARLERTRREVEADARLACRKLESAWLRHEAALARAEQARQELVDVRYLLQEDRAHVGDLAAARNRAASARAAAAASAGAYRSAVANLNRAVGVPGFARTEE